MAEQLSAAQCVLLAVHYASESDIKSLHALAPLRPDALDPELVLRILLTLLPESVEPVLYIAFVRELTSRLWLEQHDAAELDVSSVQGIPDSVAQKQVKALHLCPLVAPSFPPKAPGDLLTRFLCHRAYRIDTETGLLSMIPSLVTPFLENNRYLKMWIISVVLPLQRFRYEYYPDVKSPPLLDAFEDLDGERGIDLLLSRTIQVKHEVTSATDSKGTIGRDLRGLVGPWMYGNTERKRRKVDRNEQQDLPSTRKRGISLSGVSHDDTTGHDWEHVNTWLVRHAVDNFPLATNAIEEWDGPADVDLGGYDKQHAYLDEEVQAKLEKKYAQAAFAACYAVQADTSETIDGAHGVLARLAELLDFEPPPDLATSVEQLPKIDRHAKLLHRSDNTILLTPDVLLEPEHPLTSPTMETYMLLQMLVYSAYQLASLGNSISIVNVAKLRFFSEQDEQLALLKKILHWLSGNGKKDEQEWNGNRAKLIWLWNWGIDAEDGSLRGSGIFGNIKRDVMEKEILKVLVKDSGFDLVAELYIEQPQSSIRLSSDDVQAVIMDEAMQTYDNASNGNRTRGSMKKACSIINTFRPRFPNSKAFAQAAALVNATHALSFYSLTLQHGVPFQPVNIRVSKDPLALLPKVLEQNANSYTKLDDLVSIGRNLVLAGLPTPDPDLDQEPSRDDSDAGIKKRVMTAERRVILMCIEAALTEEDFETAYSYLVSRLAPDPTALQQVGSPAEEDDISWRAAFLAGRYRPRKETARNVRRLEQRTELLSLALLLAPASALSEILNVWRRCEEEMASLLAQEAAAEETFNDRADKRHDVPGGFTDLQTEGMVFGQQRREVGRFNAARGTGKGDGEAPMGLFDVARGAAKAFSRNAFPLHGAAGAVAGGKGHETQEAVGRRLSGDGYSGDDGGFGEGRVRKRDMVANAVTGTLTSGLGWMLGATPNDAQHRQS